MKIEIMKVKYVKPIYMGKTQRDVFTNNYWCLCQNRPAWDICFEKKPKESITETFTADT